MKINFFEVGNTILENERVILKPLSLHDFEQLLPFSENELDIWKFTLVHANGRDALINYINNALERKSANTQLPFIVIDKLTNSYAGSTRFYDIDVQNQKTQIGYTWYGKEFQGTGINVNCKYLLLEFAFHTLGFERVQFMADSRNSRSIAAMKKIGCTEEGILRSNYITSDGLRRDSIVFSILKTEWESHVKQHLISLINKHPSKCLN